MNTAITAQSHSSESLTGVPSNKLGMWLFLASEIMFFTGLIAAFVLLKGSHPHWPGPEGHLSVPIGTANTFILICSSMTMVMALPAAQEGRTGDLKKWMGLTILLGAAFLVIKGFEYHTKFEHGIFPSTNIFWSCYYALTGFHGLHVLGGIIANLCLLISAMRSRLTPDKAYGVELAGLYWHFVDIVWIFLFPMLYLMT